LNAGWSSFGPARNRAVSNATVEYSNFCICGGWPAYGQKAIVEYGRILFGISSRTGSG
jgi:hypothetical protein